MVKVSNLTKYYGSKKALDNVSFSIAKGEIVGFLGANGAGKSTTMNLISGCIFPNEGSIFVNGVSISDNPKEAKKYIGYLPEIPPLYVNMTVKDYLLYVGTLKGVKAIDDFAEICKKTGIDSVMDRLIRNLSKGYRQRVGIAMAMIGSPPVIILDEPTVGLDPQQIKDIRKLIKELGETKTVIVSSHILSEIQMVASRILMLENGRLVVDSSSNSLLVSGNCYEIVSDTAASETETILNQVPSVKSFELIDNSDKSSRYQITAENGVDPSRELFFAFSKAKVALLQMNSLNNNLEGLFLPTNSQKENVQ